MDRANNKQIVAPLRERLPARDRLVLLPTALQDGTFHAAINEVRTTRPIGRN